MNPLRDLCNRAYFNGKDQYAQSSTNITNVFLVNAQYRLKNPNSTYPKRLKIEPYGHHHTFWLKYLILAFIAARSDGGYDPVSVDDIVESFSGEDGYDRDLVALVIYSLTEVEHGRLIRPRSHDSSRFVTLTSRGLEFVSNGIGVAWSPAYLATVLEDEWLELPPRLSNTLVIFGTNAFWDKHSFSEYLKNKLQTTTRFIYCLEETLKFEKVCRPRTFGRILSVKRISEFLPEFQKVLSGVRKEFEALVNEVDDNAKESLRREIQEVLDPVTVTAEATALRGQLSALYDYRL